MKNSTRLAAGRRVILSAALICGGFAVCQTGVRAQDPPRRDGRYHYRIVGELSEADMVKLWPPARKASRFIVEPASGRRFYRAYARAGMTPLGDWIPDQALPQPGTRLRSHEEQMRLLKGDRDRDGDGMPDRVDVYPWDPNRW